MLQYSPGSLQRELSSLEQDGLLTSEKIGNMKFFSLNKKNSLLRELKKYIESAPPELAKIQIRHEKPRKEDLVEKHILKPDLPKNPPEEPLRIHIE